jgi:GT2 family glycosyltransferase
LERTSKEVQFPKVSVVIVNYNGYNSLRTFMPYLLRTKYPNFEIIVVDNASSDGSIGLLRNFSGNIKVMELENNKGFAEGTNVGAKAASGEILAFLNNDMEVHEDWLISAVSKLKSNKRVGAVQCKSMQYENRNLIDVVGLSVDKFGIANMIGRNEVDYGQYDSLKEIGAFSGGAMLIWKSVFFELGCFDPLFFMYYEDVDLSWKLRLSGYRILPVASSIVYHVRSASSETLSSLMAFHKVKNHLYCWLKNSTRKAIAMYLYIVVVLMFGLSAFSLIKGHPRIATSQFKGIIWCIGKTQQILKARKRTKELIGNSRNNSNVLFVDGIAKGSCNLSYAVRLYRSRLK